MLELWSQRPPKSSSPCIANAPCSRFNYVLFIMLSSSLSQLLKWKASFPVPRLHYAGLYLRWQHALLLTSYCLLPGEEIPAVHLKLKTERKLSCCLEFERIMENGPFFVYQACWCKLLPTFYPIPYRGSCRYGNLI